MWDEVPADQQNGIITSYNITYKSQTENDSGNVQVHGSVLQTELTNLKKYVNYNITVFASTVKGDGPASDRIVVRTDQDSKWINITYHDFLVYVYSFGNSLVNRGAYQALLLVFTIIFASCHFTKRLQNSGRTIQFQVFDRQK